MEQIVSLYFNKSKKRTKIFPRKLFFPMCVRSDLVEIFQQFSCSVCGFTFWYKKIWRKKMYKKFSLVIDELKKIKYLNEININNIVNFCFYLFFFSIIYIYFKRKKKFWLMHSDINPNNNKIYNIWVLFSAISKSNYTHQF